MRIGDIARRSGLSTSRIRFYERQGLIPVAARSENGYRDYPMSVLETLDMIHQAQSLGFTLDEIRAELVQGGGEPPVGKQILLALHEKLKALEQHINQMTHRKQRIVSLIEKYEAPHS